MLSYKLTCLLAVVSIFIGRYAVLQDNMNVFGQYILSAVTCVATLFMVELFFYFNRNKKVRR